MVRALGQIVVLLFLLGALTVAGSAAVEGGRRALGWSGLARGYWATLLGGMALLALILAVLIRAGLLTVGLGP
jgi:hypothetical protein